MTENYLTRKELAKRWKCSLTTIRRMEKRGDIRAIRLSGRIVRFDLETIRKAEEQASCELPV